MNTALMMITGWTIIGGFFKVLLREQYDEYRQDSHAQRLNRVENGWAAEAPRKTQRQWFPMTRMSLYRRRNSRILRRTGNESRRVDMQVCRSLAPLDTAYLVTRCARARGRVDVLALRR